MSGCDHTDGRETWWENDARGIPLGRVCDECVTGFLAKFRPDVLTNPRYWHDEPIDPEGTP